MAQQSSRLHRLLILLDTGSTAITRRTAARQIGDIARLRPEDLNPLLKKVSPYLRSKSWDTRVAAAQAIGAIAENVSHLSVDKILANAQVELANIGHHVDLKEILATSWKAECNMATSLSFSSFDVQRVLDHGAPLLSSGGQEYDIGVDNKTPAERLARQKQNLRRRLGLDVCEQFMDVNDMIRDDDLILHRGSSSANGDWQHGAYNRSIVGKQGVQQLVANMVPGFYSRNLSARERNLLKRKAKVTSKDGSKGLCEDDDADEPSSKRAKGTKSVIVDQSKGVDKLLMEAVIDDESSGEFGDGRWPFGHFVEQLIHDMFDPVWEVRHGSIMALREILTVQAASAAVVAPELDTKSMLESEAVRREMPISPKRERDIDLNIGLGFEESLDLKRIKVDNPFDNEVTNTSSCHQLGKPKMNIPMLEQGWLGPNSGTGQTTTNFGAVKAELDLNEDIRNAVFLVENKEKYDYGTGNEKFFLSSLDVPCNLPEYSKAIKLFRATQQAWAANADFLQDCAIRLLCTFSLDRFGDYVSDQVVAPVRETCAQALGAVLKHMHPSLVHETLRILLHMQGRPEWEVRHGSLLGIKYLVAVRKEMLPDLLPKVLPACIVGLEDRDDDVRAVAAEALTPAAAVIVSYEGNAVNTILLLLWDILLDLDDLSPSTSSVMHLLAELYSQPEVVPKSLGTRPEKRPMFDLNEAVQLDDEIEGETKPRADPFLLSTLAPRLWPFMRHSISSVRHAAICTLERLLETGNHENSEKITSNCFWAVPILGEALRLVFQNLLLESDETIIECSKRVWRLLLQCPQDDLASAANSYFSSWLKLASTAAGSPLETSKMFSPTLLPRKSYFKAVAKLKAAKGEVSTTGDAAWHWQKEDAVKDKTADASCPSSVLKVVVGADTEKSVTQMRVATASALGILAANLPESIYGLVIEALAELLASTFSVQRQVASMVLVSWFKEFRGSSEKAGIVQAIGAAKRLRLRLLELLGCSDPAVPSPDSSLPYAELTRIYAKMRGEVASLIKNAEVAGIIMKCFPSGLPCLEGMNAEAAIEVATKMNIAADGFSVDGSIDEKQSSSRELVEPSRQSLLATAGYLKVVQNNLHQSVLASMAGAVVWMGDLPIKLNPIIQPLMAAVKREQEEVLQLEAAEALAEIIAQCVGRKPSPNEKLTKNLCMLTCADPSETPLATHANASGINLDDGEGVSVKNGGQQRQKSQIILTGEERSRMEGIITRRGAELALKSLCDKFGCFLFDKLPKLWDCLTEAFKLPATSGADECPWRGPGTVEQSAEPQALINNLQVVRSIAPVLEKSLQSRLMILFPAIFGCIRHRHAAVRLAASRCVTSMAKALRESVMLSVLEKAVPMLEDSSSVEARQGAGMLVTSLVEGLGADLVAYAPLLIVPLLGCMSDSDSTVRQSVTHSFAALVPLLPLARGLPPPSGLDESFSLRSTEDTRFLEQLLDNSQVDDYKICVDLKTPLRRYQQEGINWLAFLKRFKLHGILCDDMGLGKTLQASAILASDMVERIATHGGKSRGMLPSLIICPSTLVGHWVFEIDKFLETSLLNPLQYIGSPQDRLQLQAQFGKHNLIVTSYDVLRKDADVLGKVMWNYCILDEGHIIKNSKSKITMAVKRIKAEHRLILSGTPIQNHVLELWSLFDFLMPGFLGTERQFQSAYGKPILAARDPKCSAKEAEAGALAMEALHKQVMPFLLRRTKDEVLADLPPKIIQDRYCDLSPLQLRLYERFSRSQARKEVANLVQVYGGSSDPAGASSTDKTSTHVFQALQYLRKLCSHPLLVLDDMQPDFIASIQSEVSSNSKDLKTSLHELQHAPKLLALKEILEECGIGLQAATSEAPGFGEGGQHRVLIFAQLKSFLDIIEKDLFQTHMKGVTYLRLDGSVEPEKRFDIVKAFNSDPTIDVLLLTTHVGGLGLNLTAADTVVFMEHDWNPMRDLQAMDRAHRLGQRRVVNVHRLIMRGTLEEKVMSLQRFKLSVANAVINAENASLNTMDTTQLLDLFTVSAGKGTQSRRNAAEDEQDSSAVAVTAGSGKGLKAMLSGLEELWDQSQYNEEYNLNQFVARLSG